MFVRASLSISVAALAIAPANATTYTTREQIEQHKAKLASWDSFGGLWEATVSAVPPDDRPRQPIWNVQMIVSGSSVVITMRHVSNGSVVEFTSAAVTPNSKTVIYVDAASLVPRYSGRFEITLVRQETDNGLLSITRWHPPPTMPGQLQEISTWYGTAERRRGANNRNEKTPR